MATGTLTSNQARGRSGGSSPSVHPRRKPVGRRHKSLRRRHWLRWVIAFLVLALLGGVVWLLGFSSVLATREVRVVGVEVLDSSQVREAAVVPEGLPLARQDLDAIAARVARLAPVDEVTVERTWPDAVTIKVRERSPLLAVKQDVGYALVDAAGVAFDRAYQVPAGIALAEADLSQTALLVEIGTVTRALPADVRKTITKISATSPARLTVTLSSGVTVDWGTADQSKLKAQIVSALLERKPKSIDVSSPHNPAIR